MYRSKKVAKTDFKKCSPILPSNYLLRHYLGPFIPEFKNEVYRSRMEWELTFTEL